MRNNQVFNKIYLFLFQLFGIGRRRW